MNERIKELERQCWKSTDADPYALFDVKKFAELIVKECSRLIETREPRTEPAPHIYLLKVFGVEE